jgi:hypothetical protein
MSSKKWEIFLVLTPTAERVRMIAESSREALFRQGRILGMEIVFLYTGNLKSSKGPTRVRRSRA